MSKEVRIIGIKRKQIDHEKLALAFLLLAKSLHGQRKIEADDSRQGDEGNAA